MKYLKNISLAVMVILSFCNFGLSQVRVELSIANQHVEGSDFLFDIYLKTIQGTSGPLFLDNSDFILNFNEQHFLNYSIAKEPNPNPPEPVPGFQIQNGYCSLISELYTDPDNILAQNNVQKSYFDNTSVSFVNDQIVINLNGPAPADQNAMDQKVAKIGNETLTHRLGRFRISGISNPAGFMNIEWQGGNSGLRTRVFTLNNIVPFTSTEVLFGTDLILSEPENVSLPIELLEFDAQPVEDVIQLTWLTEYEELFSHFELERAEDGLQFKKLASVLPGRDHIGYSYLDQNVRNNQNYYYRLKLVDLDRTYFYSEIRTAKLSFKPGREMTVFPNPVVNILHANIYLDNSEQFLLELIDPGGIVNLSERYQGARGENNISVTLAENISGLYYLRISLKDRQYVEKILIIR